jgi:diadenosine tetraphosphatase ApaH/serine/threonine PP2A family protein phosphatase
LTAVLEDIQETGAKRIFCLGDVIGYGPDPGPALDMAKQHCETVIMGNHDYATLYEPTRFNIGAENAVFWTRDQLEREPDKGAAAERWKFLGTNDVRHAIDGEQYGVDELLFTHGSPRRPINEYLFSEDIHNNPGKLNASMERFDGICFVGHTHIPGIFTSSMEFFTPDEINGVFEYNDSHSKVIVNVGSIGQPRDRDPRSCYVVVEPGKITFRRVEYDVQTTVEKLLNIRQLDDSLATRLNSGR